MEQIETITKLIKRLKQHLSNTEKIDEKFLSNTYEMAEELIDYGESLKILIEAARFVLSDKI